MVWKVPGKFTGASRNAIPGSVKFPVNRPGKSSNLGFTGAFENQAPAKWLKSILYSVLTKTTETIIPLRPVKPI